MLSHSFLLNGNLCKVIKFPPIYTKTVMKQNDQSKKEGEDQESIHLSTIPDPGYQWESDNKVYNV